MAAFELPQELRDIYGGAAKLDIRQMLPQTSAVSGVRPNVGAASGITTFQWQEGQMWWIPALSYFELRGHFLSDALVALARPPTGQLGYCDNWPATLFSQVNAFLDSSSLELLQAPAHVADTVLTYSTVDRTFLKSFASNAGIGESLQTRILNSAQFGTSAPGATNYNEVVACFRPALSIFDCATALPPGPQWRFDFNWNPNGEQQMIESISSKIAGTDYSFVIDSFTYFRAAVMPDQTVALPETGLIELNPVTVQTFPLTGGANLQPQIPLPPKANRVLVAIQDNNAANNLAAGQNGIKPATDFHVGFSSGASDNAAYIQQMYLSAPDIGVQAPSPAYSFTSLAAAGAKSGYERAYADWIAVCKGGSGGYEGSVPFGCADEGVGAAVIAPLLTGGGPVVQIGNPENDQQLWIASAGTGASTYTATTAARTAKYGWLGRKAIFAFPIVHPPGMRLSNALLNLQMTAAVTSILVYVVTSFSLPIAIEREAGGKYKYHIVRDY